MKTKTLFLCALIAGALLSCNPAVKNQRIAEFSSVDALMQGDTTRTGFFTNTSLFDSIYSEINYVTTRGNVLVANDGTQNFLLCRYDTVTHQPIWIAVGGGSGNDGGCNYYVVPPENAVYVVGYFEGTAYFPHRAGGSEYDTLVTNGNIDMFVAKYTYSNGVLLWCTSGGSPYRDVVFTDNLGVQHKETLMAIDSATLTVSANFFGPSRFGKKTINAQLSGAALQIKYDKATGGVVDVQFYR